MKIVERRRYPRKDLNAKARVIIHAPDLKLMEDGEAKLRNISQGGAFISDLELPGKSFPNTHFQVGLFIEEGALKGIGTTCSSITQFSSNGRISMGLRFDKIGERHQQQILNFVRL